MQIMMNSNIISNIRQLSVSLKLNTNNKHIPPIKNNGYIIDPNKFRNEIKNYDINLDEIKALLLMMIKGNDNFISELIKPNGNNFVNRLV